MNVTSRQGTVDATVNDFRWIKGLQGTDGIAKRKHNGAYIFGDFMYEKYL